MIPTSSALWRRRYRCWGSAQEDVEATPEAGSARKCSAIPGKGQWALKRLEEQGLSPGAQCEGRDAMASLSGSSPPPGSLLSPGPGPLAILSAVPGLTLSTLTGPKARDQVSDARILDPAKLLRTSLYSLSL